MFLITKILRMIKGLLNDTVESLQNPSRDARQIIRDLDFSIEQAESSFIEIQAQVANQRSKRDAADAKILKYSEGAVRALKKGNETLAREALAAQVAAENERDQLTSEISKIEPSINDLREQIINMRKHRNSLQSRSTILVAKQEITKAKQTAATALGGIGGKNFSEDFNRLEEKVNIADAHSTARLETIDNFSNKNLDDKLNAIEQEQNPTIDERLEKLKIQLNQNKS